ncbi:Alpha/beta hydrolase family protein [Streptomyces sp. 1222.5]|uniref:alpha/beta fold hydrolase n=1 Tax=unclassified Streptomyces TaxID=2593676 RepID=UPI00089AE0F7|nr:MULTISPECIES: alpha/beta hydrolase family protein [unclassified Streptomyces]PKW09707.1 alpha/beta hydrolase family protein [Streptomyces sp. 5112.2]SEC27209.1 Alpha/beta hydrolase family protein [Streptomyces sp. 1222.5]
MTTFVLVHGAWHGPWAWDRIVPLLHAAGARTLTPDLSAVGDHGLHAHAQRVVAALDTVPDDEELVLVGHSYAGLVVREAADLRPDAVGHIVLLDGWAGPDGASMFSLAPDAFADAVRAAAERSADGRCVPAPPPAAFGIVDTDSAAWLAARLLPQLLRTFTEPTRLAGAVDRIPGTAVHCRPQTYPFDRMGAAVGYRTYAMDGPHDVMLTRPEPLARVLVEASSFKNGKRRV